MTVLPEDIAQHNHTSGLFPHSVVAGTSSPPDDDKAYRLAHATYRMIVSLESIVGRIRQPGAIWRSVQRRARADSFEPKDGPARGETTLLTYGQVDIGGVQGRVSHNAAATAAASASAS
jgi:hypothetical protein